MKTHKEIIKAKKIISNTNDLLIERNECLELELSDNHWGKLKGEAVEGCVVYIEWKEFGRDYLDEGYIFCLPECKIDEADCFIHFPKTQNPGGRGDGEPMFDHLYYLMINDQVVLIEFINKTN